MFLTTAGGIRQSRSPTWHRSARKQRSQARRLIHEVRARGGKRRWKFWRAIALLAAHHSKPIYREMQGWPYPKYNSWGGWSPQMPRQKKKDKGGDATRKTKKEESTIRPYDATGEAASGQSSSLPSSSSQQAAQDFMQEFFNMAKENNMEIPQKLQKFMPSQETDTRQTLKEQQRKLNRHRNVLSKIEAKEKARIKDEEKWDAWVKEVKEALASEKCKHEERQTTLKKELEELRKEEEKIRMSQDEENMEETEEDPAHELDDFLGNKKTEKPEEEVEARVQEMKRRLEREYQIKLQQHKAQVEQQCMLMLMQRKSDVIDVDDEDPEMIAEADASEKGPQNSTGGAYGARKARPRTETSPYGRKQNEQVLLDAKSAAEQRMEQRMKQQPEEVEEPPVGAPQAKEGGT